MNNKIKFAKNLNVQTITSMDELNKMVVGAQDSTDVNVEDGSSIGIQYNLQKEINSEKVIPVEQITQEVKKENDSKLEDNKSSILPSIKNNIKEADQLYESRSLSWLRFNRRVLELAKDPSIPLFERLKYLSITESNLDEFNMVRLPKLLSGEFDSGDAVTPESVLSHREYKSVKAKMNSFITEQHVVHKELLLSLEKEGIILVVDEKQLSKKEFHWAKNYFEDKIFSLLTPIVYDNMRPFQVLRNNRRYIGVMLRDNKMDQFGTIEVPTLGDRLIELKTSEEGKRKFILIEHLIKMFMHKLFIGKKMIKSSISIFRVLKSTNYEVETDEIVVQVLERKLKRNEHGDVMRIDILGDTDNEIKSELKDLVATKNTIFNKVNSVVDLSYMIQFMDIELSKEQIELYKYPEFRPRVADQFMSVDLFDILKDDDILLQHPYEPYQTVLDFINQAADDPNTVCIKQTLYRVSKDSPIVEALARAARKGIMVTVVCEVKARFDEMNNIEMAREIERAGGQVVYGVNNLKIHSKMCMVIKRTNKGNLEKYVHIGTGNYNEKTSKIYTDISYFTSKKHIVKDIENVFNSLTGFSELRLNRIYCSPNGISNKIIDLINKEISVAKNGKEAYINIKVNGLTDKIIIDKLYEAAEAGVKITLIVRGMCSLLNTDNIIVKSIVGRFLEHSRIYEFGNDGDSEIYISSADLMERNLYNRVELLVPINGKAKKRISSIMDKYIKDESAFYLINGEYNRKSYQQFTESLESSEYDLMVKDKLKDNQKQDYNFRLYSAQDYFVSKMKKIRKMPVHKFVTKGNSK